MKYVITGAAGHISKPLVERLLGKGHDVTIIGRDAEHLQPLTEKGAKAAIGSVDDVSFLKQAFTGADAVYTMVPPQYAAAVGLQAYDQVGARYAEAIKANNVQYVVNLSSIGAHLEEGCGPVSGLYRIEQQLNKTGAHVLHLRPGYFFINFFGNIGMIKGMNIIGGNYGDSTTKMILSHPDDIAEAAAEELLNLSFKGHSVRYLASDERTTADVAKVLGAAVGKPELPWVAFTDEQAFEGLLQAGLPQGMVEKYVEMGAAIRSGKMWEDYYKNKPASFGKTKLEDFAPSFANAYNAG